MTQTNISQIIRDIKDYQQLQDSLRQEIESLKKKAIDYMTFCGVDEIAVADGKITYRQVISKRFDSTSFKHDFADVYEEYTRTTTSMRFTCH